jgi:hypothetical protein
MAATNVQAFSGDLDIAGAITSNLAVSGSKFTYDNTNTTIFTGTSSAGTDNEIGVFNVGSEAGNNTFIDVRVVGTSGSSGNQMHYRVYFRPDSATNSFINSFERDTGGVLPVVYRTNAADITGGVVRIGYTGAKGQYLKWHVEVSRRYPSDGNFQITNTGSAVDGTGLAVVTSIPATRFNSNVAINVNTLFVNSEDSRVGIGTTVPLDLLEVYEASKFSVDVSDATYAKIGNLWSSDDVLSVVSAGSVIISCDYNANQSGKSIEFRTNSSENSGTLIAHMRDNGRTAFNKNSPAALVHLKSTGEAAKNGCIRLERHVYSWYWEIHTADEDLFFSHNNTMKAWIDRSGGSNVKLNFTGQHRTFVEDLLYSDAEPKKGLIVSAVKNQYIKMSGGIEAGSNAITINESLPIVSISNVANDKMCFGVISDAEDPDQRIVELGHFKSLESKEDGDTRIYINSVGEGAIWVTDINGSLESGDYITTSNIAGYGMKQDDDILHNYTVAKITMDCDFNPSTQPVKRLVKELKDVQYWIETTYSDISYENYSNLSPEDQYIKLETYYLSENGEISAETYEKLTSEQKTKYTEMTRTTYQCVSTVEYKTDPGPDVENVTTEVRQEYVNVLDENGQIMWEEHPTDTEKAYKIRYLDAGGVETNEANHVYKAAFIGCTYHCG